MHNTILQSVKKFLNVKNDKPQKNYIGKVPAPCPPFKKTCTWTIPPPLLLIFQIPPSGGRKNLFPPLKNGGWKQSINDSFQFLGVFSRNHVLEGGFIFQ